LDGVGYPTFSYMYKNVTLKDTFIPLEGGRGLKRTFSISNAPDTGVLLLRLAEGSDIIEVADNVFAVDDQHYYVQITSSGTNKPFLRNNGNKKELVVAVNGNLSQVTYSLLW